MRRCDTLDNDNATQRKNDHVVDRMADHFDFSSIPRTSSKTLEAFWNNRTNLHLFNSSDQWLIDRISAWLICSLHESPRHLKKGMCADQCSVVRSIIWKPPFVTHETLSAAKNHSSVLYEIRCSISVLVSMIYCSHLVQLCYHWLCINVFSPNAITIIVIRPYISLLARPSTTRKARPFLLWSHIEPSSILPPFEYPTIFRISYLKNFAANLLSWPSQ